MNVIIFTIIHVYSVLEINTLIGIITYAYLAILHVEDAKQ